jgi:cytochrome c peroxidase
VYDFSRNPLSEEKIALGRVLFYDPILSKDGSISCASCHSSYNAFAHTDHALSHGIYDSVGLRNAPALMNLAWQPHFMWDGAVHHLDVQALAPIASPSEMGGDFAQVIAKLRETERYPSLFQAAYGDSAITGERFLKALAQFQLTLVSAGSRYDRMREGRLVFSPQEEQGYQVFKEYCGRCHVEPLFSNYAFSSHGLPPDPLLGDLGRYRITGNPADSLLFKTPTLRNLAYTYPYMHDGRFRTLRQVLDHYEEASLPTALGPAQKADLLAFLRTLNDSSFVFEPRFQFPAVLWER